MTLQEAINTGKRFGRTTDADEGSYYTAAEFLEGGITIEDYNATDYELEPEASVVLSEKVLMNAWNGSRPAGGTVAAAPDSSFYARFKSELIKLGITVS